MQLTQRVAAPQQASRTSRTHTRRWRLSGSAAAAFCVAISLVLLTAGVASAHIIHTNGTWTYRYLTRHNLSDCSGGSGGGDPLNVLFWQYGEGSRMNSHADADTDWGFYPSFVSRSSDYICGDSDSYVGDYTVNDYLDFDDQEGHGSWDCTCGVRAHFRIWYAPHSHSSDIDKWSTIDVHHEQDVWSSSTLVNHAIDEDWETWEYHIGSEFGASGHNFYYDYWARQGGQYLQGFYDDGYITRVGGLHNGVY
jgi:hypothetical protein